MEKIDRRQYYRRSRAKIKKRVREKIFKRDGYKCLECGSKENLTIDHVIPKLYGGTDKQDNLITLCKNCNLKKGAKLNQKYVLMNIESRNSN